VNATGFELASHRQRRFWSGRHRRRNWLAVLAALLVVAMGGAALALRASSFAHRPNGADCSGTPVTVTVATAQSDLATFSALARRWTATNPAADGRCLAATVVPAAPADAAAQLGPGWDPAHQGSPPQVWLPDSSLWLAAAAIRPDAAQIVSGHPTSIASSPVVLAVRQPVAQALGWPQRPLAAQQLMAAFADATKTGQSGPPMKLGMVDPQKSTAGLAMALALLDPNATGTVSNAQLLAGIQFSQVLGTVAPDVQTFLTALDRPAGGADVAAFPALERDLAGYDAAAPANPLVPAYQPNSVLADFPYTILSGSWVDAAHRSAAEQFRQYLLGPAAQDFLATQGLRAPDRTARNAQYLPTAQGFQPTVPAPRPPSTPAGLREIFAQWSQIQRPSNVLVVLDTSGSMNFPVPGGTGSKLQLLQQTTTAGFSLLTNATSIGLWDFSVRPDRAGEHRELVSFGPIFGGVGPVSRQKALYGAVTGLRANGFTPLYDTAYAAFHEMQKQWQPNATNVVLLVTDGANELDGGLDLPGLVDRLRHEQRADRPVQIISIAVGSEADANALQQISAATGGHILLARDPTKAVQQLVLAFAGRLA
jgi:Ca-activated chloride channel homolog